MLSTLALAAALPQSPVTSPTVTPANAVETVSIALQPAGEDSRVRLRWSPKGAKVTLTAAGPDVRTGSFRLGPAGTPPVKVRLERSGDSEHFDRLRIDRNRDGDWGEDEVLACTPRLNRHKWWSSFSAVVQVPVPAQDDRETGPTSRPYPLNLWFVVDPREDDPWPELRWSRRGWHEGTCEIGGEPAYVVITESNMDGVFSPDDAWELSRDPAGLGRSHGALSSHRWLDGVAWRVKTLDPHGRSITIEPFDPGFTEAEEKARRAKRGPADAELPRAEKPLAFGKDLAAALALAKREGRRVFVDFETTWCGPCRAMNRAVYPAKAVVDAATTARLICVKLDGDDEFDLVNRYGVSAYPTVLLLDGDGKVLARAVGYRSVPELARFMAGPAAR